MALGYQFADILPNLARSRPEVYFIYVDGEAQSIPKLVCIDFFEEQGSHLAGMLAALVSASELPRSLPGVRVGFLGGMDIALIREFQIGFERAGARGLRAYWTLAFVGILLPIAGLSYAVTDRLVRAVRENAVGAARESLIERKEILLGTIQAAKHSAYEAAHNPDAARLVAPAARSPGAEFEREGRSRLRIRIRMDSV